MAKRTRPGKASSTVTAPELTQSPFAALADLTAGPADRPSPPSPSPTETPASETEIRFDTKVVVRREKKGRGGKTVTRISGIHTEDQAAVAKRMKKSLGCGASLDGADVILHGSLVTRAAEWLEAHGARRVVRAN